jgi:hypothetical protein
VTRIDLPDGQWAELWAPRHVKERRRRRWIALTAEVTASTADLPRDPDNPRLPDRRYFGARQMELSDRMGDALVLCFVREWSFGEVTEDALEDLDQQYFDPIFRACRDLASELLPDYSPDVDPKAPTGGSTPQPTDMSTAPTTYAIPSFATTT